MQYSVVKYTDVLRQEDLRFDADYYKPKYLKEDAQLKKFSSLQIEELAFVTDGQHGYHEVDDNSPIFHLTAKNAKNWFADSIGADKIAKWVDDNNKRSSLKENDLILSTRGTVGYCAIVKKDVLPSNIDQDVARIAIDSKIIIPEYVLTFLNCHYGQDWLQRNTTGMVQQGLSLQKVRRVPIPILDLRFQKTIKANILNAYKVKKNSENYFEQAQNILLSELGLTNWQPKHQLTFIKNYSDTQQAERIDAEYFQPKYEAIAKAIKDYKGGWDTLGNLVTVKKCVEVGSGEYFDEGIPFIRVSNLNPFEITEEKYISEKLYQEIKQHQPGKGEILFSKDATPGIAYYLNERPQKMIPSGGILRLKSKSSKVNNEYLTLVLNSLLIQEQINRDVGGSVILHWRPDQVKETVIPILSEPKQLEIQQKVNDSFMLRKKSKQLLENAKRAVEIAIEESEEKAMKWLQLHENIEKTEQCN